MRFVAFYRIPFLFLFLTVSLLFACSKSQKAEVVERTSDMEVRVRPDTTVEQAVRTYVEVERCGRGKTEIAGGAEVAWYAMHCDAILETLEVPRVKAFEGVKIAFYKFSVEGSTIQKTGIFQPINHPEHGIIYAHTFSGGPSYYEATQREKSLADEEDEWQESSSSWSDLLP